MWFDNPGPAGVLGQEGEPVGGAQEEALATAHGDDQVESAMSNSAKRSANARAFTPRERTPRRAS